jgi:hypothetical protein
MKTCHARLRSRSPYSQSAVHATPKLNKEGPDSYEERTWRELAFADAGTAVLFAGRTEGHDVCVRVRGW